MRASCICDDAVYRVYNLLSRIFLPRVNETNQTFAPSDEWAQDDSDLGWLMLVSAASDYHL